MAVRVRSRSIDRHLKLALRSARAIPGALVIRGPAFTSRRTSHSRRALIPFVYGVAVGAVVTLLLLVQSIPGATMLAPGPAVSQVVSRVNVALLSSVQPPDLPSVRPPDLSSVRPPDLSSVRPPDPSSVRPPENARSVEAPVEQMVTTTGRQEPDQTSALLSPPQSSSGRNTPSSQSAPSPKLAEYRGSLDVSSAPSGATVLVNGVPVGTTPLLLKDLPVGSRVVRLELDGYRGWSSAVSVVANKLVLTSVDLQPSPSTN